MIFYFSPPPHLKNPLQEQQLEILIPTSIFTFFVRLERWSKEALFRLKPKDSLYDKGDFSSDFSPFDNKKISTKMWRFLACHLELLVFKRKEMMQVMFGVQNLISHLRRKAIAKIQCARKRIWSMRNIFIDFSFLRS